MIKVLDKLKNIISDSYNLFNNLKVVFHSSPSIRDTTKHKFRYKKYILDNNFVCSYNVNACSLKINLFGCQLSMNNIRIMVLFLGENHFSKVHLLIFLVHFIVWGSSYSVLNKAALIIGLIPQFDTNKT